MRRKDKASKLKVGLGPPPRRVEPGTELPGAFDTHWDAKVGSDLDWHWKDHGEGIRGLLGQYGFDANEWHARMAAQAARRGRSDEAMREWMREEDRMSERSELMHTTIVRMKDGREITGILWSFRPAEGYMTLTCSGDEDGNKLMLGDMESAVTKDERLGARDGRAIIGDDDLMAKARKYMREAREHGWDDVRPDAPAQAWETA